MILETIKTMVYSESALAFLWALTCIISFIGGYVIMSFIDRYVCRIYRNYRRYLVKNRKKSC